jgi:hypothetical protein
MSLTRQARLAQSMDEAKRPLDETRKVESEQRRQRQEIFAVEDEIEARRDALIAALEKRLHRASHTRHLFTIRWEVACRIAEMRFWRHDRGVMSLSATLARLDHERPIAASPTWSRKTSPNGNKRQQLVDKLKEMLQIDLADLGFGI